MTKHFHCELTDTFGGEANYCWVRRATIAARGDGESNRGVVTRAKAALGLTGVKCDSESSSVCADEITLRPRGLLQIAFITFCDNPDCETPQGVDE